ncbi:MAG: transposase [Nitrosomonas sp.]|nr:transposase [Nitrosomonas sp.]MDP1951043.1 transposase [Nitrosomonas sp.]
MRRHRVLFRVKPKISPLKVAIAATYSGGKRGRYPLLLGGKRGRYPLLLDSITIDECQDQYRTVFAGIPHHITQRGNRRETVFFSDEDRKIYLDWLKEYCGKHGVDILAYCLMTNHIHLVTVYETEAGLQKVLKPLHMRYAQKINRDQNNIG